MNLRFVSRWSTLLLAVGLFHCLPVLQSLQNDAGESPLFGLLLGAGGPAGDPGAATPFRVEDLQIEAVEVDAIQLSAPVVFRAGAEVHVWLGQDDRITISGDRVSGAMRGPLPADGHRHARKHSAARCQRDRRADRLHRPESQRPCLHRAGGLSGASHPCNCPQSFRSVGPRD